MAALQSSNDNSEVQKPDKNLLSLSLTIVLGIPNLVTKKSQKSCAMSIAEAVYTHGTNTTYFDNLSTMVKMLS